MYVGELFKAMPVEWRQRDNKKDEISTHHSSCENDRASRLWQLWIEHGMPTETTGKVIQK